MKNAPLYMTELLGVLASACLGNGSHDSDSTSRSQQALEALVPLAGCNEVEAYVRQRMTEEVNRIVDSEIKSLETCASSSSCWIYGGGASLDAGAAPPESSRDTGGTASSDSSNAGSSTSDRASSTSTTNNQVASVDEADFIKNDDKYLYVAANGAFRIVEAWPAESAHELSKVKIDGTPKKLFVDGNHALVYVSVPRSERTPNGNGRGDISGGSYGGDSGECTYGYDCVPSGDGTETRVLIFDITNRAAPQKVREIELTGSLLSARRIGSAVHTIVVERPEFGPRIDTSAVSQANCNYWSNQSTIAAQVYAACMITAWEAVRASNLQRILAADVRSSLPEIRENGTSSAAACSGYYRPALAESLSFTSVVSLDMASNSAPISATVVSDPGVVYASESGLYMSIPHTKPGGEGIALWYPGVASEQQASLVHKFRIGATPSLTGYQASGIVKGRVLGQFSLDEHDAHLRIATTTGHAPSPETHSTMSVLEQRGEKLEVIGKVDGIAPSEDIRSVRFDGSRGYVVTFKKTDPLYVFDLGNPTEPKITGELKIPGFSTYMHMMDAQHLLTIGYDADDRGSFAWFTGVLLQVFDVSDMKNPTLKHKVRIGTRGSSSEALTNHLAFTYYAPKNVLALPMTICEGGAGGSYGTNMTFSGLMVYDVTTNDGFSLRGRIEHPNSTQAATGYDSGACSSWWTNARSEVKRSVIMENFVYSVSDRIVKVRNLNGLSSPVAEVSLEN
jgi:uncharacterized secreted protein with C-terminal beta-propeller domain